MPEIEDLKKKLEEFRDERDWQQFHDPKNLALALSIEAAELNELFLWKKGQEIDLIDREKLKEEIADVFAYAILLAGSYGFNVSEIVSQKIKKNAQKYPVEEFRGSAKKYTELNEIRDKS